MSKPDTFLAGNSLASRIFYRFAWMLIIPPIRLYTRMTINGREHLPKTGAFVLAPVHRSYVDTPIAGCVRSKRMRFMGKDAVGFGVVMLKGGNVLGLGKNVDELMARIERDLPVGVEVNVVADQPKVVRLSFALFFRTLMEAIGIVLLVSFVSLGWRTGMVVALSIPLALAITFIVMNLTDIPLQRVSLGALVISLGLLVDDAIIAVEMMMVKIEQGWDRMRAARLTRIRISIFW